MLTVKARISEGNQNRDIPFHIGSKILLLKSDRAWEPFVQSFAVDLNDEKTHTIQLGGYSLFDAGERHLGVMIENIILTPYHDLTRLRQGEYGQWISRASDLDATGLSLQEEWGRWSDADLADSVTFKYKDLLPQKFELTVDFPYFIGENTLAVSVVFPDESTAVINNNIPLGQWPAKINLLVDSSIYKRQPTGLVFTPQKKGRGGCGRMLGIGFSNLLIKPIV